MAKDLPIIIQESSLPAKGAFNLGENEGPPDPSFMPKEDEGKDHCRPAHIEDPMFKKGYAVGRSELARLIWEVLDNDESAPSLVKAAIEALLESFRPDPKSTDQDCEHCQLFVKDPENPICPFCGEHWRDWVGDLEKTVVYEG